MNATADTPLDMAPAPGSPRRRRRSAQEAQITPQEPLGRGAKTAQPDRYQDASAKEDPVARQLVDGRHWLGQLLRNWFALNGWSYDTATAISQAYSPQVPLLHGSQLSNLISGKVDPKPRLFMGLGLLNRACGLTAEQRSALDTPVAQKLNGARAVCHPNGEPWSSGDFLRCFCGEIPPPEELLLAHRFDEERAELLSENLPLLVQALCAERNLKLRQAITALSDLMPVRLRNRTRLVLGGIEVFSAGDLEEALQPLCLAFSRWLGAAISPGQLLELLETFHQDSSGWQRPAAFARLLSEEPETPEEQAS